MRKFNVRWWAGPHHDQWRAAGISHLWEYFHHDYGAPERMTDPCTRIMPVVWRCRG